MARYVRYFRLIFTITWTTAFLITISGCGRKSPPVPPGTLKPRPPQGLTYTITKDGVVISWIVPTKNIDGSPIFGLKGFEVFKAKVPIDEATCPQCPKRFESPIWIPFKGKLRNGLRISYEDHTVTSGFRYYYAVRTSKGIFSKSELSKELELLWHSPAMAPRKLRAIREGHGSIKITWQPPGRFEDGTSITQREARNLSYDVFRRSKGTKEWTRIKQGLKDTCYTDGPVPFDLDYEYKVQSIYQYHKIRIPGGITTVEAPLIQTKAITRRPRHLVALPGKDGIELHWDAMLKESEGFLIYRAGPNGLVDTINRQPIRKTVFTDTTKLPPGTYTYWVTIVKTRPVWVEGPRSNSVKVKVK